MTGEYVFKPSSTLVKLVRRHGLRCHWCGLFCDPLARWCDGDFLSAEHLKKRENGGGNGMANLRLAHRKCNCVRHSRHFEEYLRRRRSCHARTFSNEREAAFERMEAILRGIRAPITQAELREAAQFDSAPRTWTKTALENPSS